MAVKQPFNGMEVEHLAPFNHGDPPAADLHAISPNLQQIQPLALDNANTQTFNMKGFEIG